MHLPLQSLKGEEGAGDSAVDFVIIIFVAGIFSTTVGGRVVFLSSFFIYHLTLYIVCGSRVENHHACVGGRYHYSEHRDSSTNWSKSAPWVVLEYPEYLIPKIPKYSIEYIEYLIPKIPKYSSTREYPPFVPPSYLPVLLLSPIKIFMVCTTTSCAVRISHLTLTQEASLVGVHSAASTCKC